MWPVTETGVSELGSPGSHRIWGWHHQLEDTYKFEQVTIPLLAVSVHFLFLISALRAGCHRCLNQRRDSHWISGVTGLVTRLLYWEGMQLKKPYCSHWAAAKDDQEWLLERSREVQPWSATMKVAGCILDTSEAWPEAAVWQLGPTGALPRHMKLQKGILFKSQSCNFQMVGFDLQQLSQQDNVTAVGETSGRCVDQEESSAGK